jgi:hypothetical protein
MQSLKYKAEVSAEGKVTLLVLKPIWNTRVC